MTAATRQAGAARPGLNAVTLLGVLGVVYGDIGTSPLYAFQTSIAYFHHKGIVPWEVLGLLSMIFWSLVLIVTVKYVMVVMHADNRGEGGIMALTALAQRVVPGPRARKVLGLIGLLGACLFFGDGMITPAISVLSAVEGLEVSTPQLAEVVLPISAIVIIVLFALQSRGTASVGKLFGPVMVVWFVAIGLFGLLAILKNPMVLLALSPTYAFAIVAHEPIVAYFTLGAVVLAVTGAEALYADMGHFGPKPIRVMWSGFVLPSLALNYFGQGALVLANPDAAANPFYLLAPSFLQLPLVVLATAATVIASQAVISGAYSMAQQCVQLGLLPRLTITHTSAAEEGQIFIPQINTLLALGVLALVFAFRSSASLASAYGIAVTGTFLCTALLAAVVFHRQFHWSRARALAVFGPLAVLDILFFTANLAKLPEGGWVPIAFGLFLLAVMTSWQRGRDLLLARWRQDSLPLANFLARLPRSRIIRVPGIAVFLTSTPDYVPGALLHNLKHNKVLHERVLFVTVSNEDVPEVAQAERCGVEQMAPGIYRVMISYGFMESPNLPRDLESLRGLGVDFDPMQVSYFLSRDVLVPASVPRMPLWRQWLFLALARNAISAVDFFRIPSDRVVELGVRVAI